VAGEGTEGYEGGNVGVPWGTNPRETESKRTVEWEKNVRTESATNTKLIF
jgi:hypothetical protein